MTEAEWLASVEPRRMLGYLAESISERKSRLFSVACCYRVWNWMTDARTRKVVETAEAFADGEIGLTEWKAISEAGRQAYRKAGRNVYLIREKAVKDRATLSTACAICSAAVAAYYVAHCLFRRLDLPGNPLNVSSAVANVAGLAMEAKSAGVDRVMQASNTEREFQASLIRCIFGNPFRALGIDSSWLTWRDGTLPKLAQAIYLERSFEQVPILADALEEAECRDNDIVSHCRGPGPHVRGCWVVDLLLGKK